MDMDTIKDHFENEAREFERIILTLIPHYATMVRALVEAIPFERSMPLRVIDLGCGTGTISEQLLELFPHAQVTCLDFAENMIAVARAKLARFPHVNCLVADFRSFDLSAPYDAVISSLALHHIVTDEGKRHFYRRVYESLSSGGVFYNADIVLASSDFLQTVYMREWRRFMAQGVAEDEIEGKWIPKYQEEDCPAKLVDHLQWMKEAGFVDIDVLWKYFNFAVYGGVRR
jgi:tRNA (cmo5U34)-methyltransferase